MAVALIHGGGGGQAISVPRPFHVEEPRAFAALDDHVQREIIVRAVGFFEGDELFGSRQTEVRGRHANTPVESIGQVFKAGGERLAAVTPAKAWNHYGIGPRIPLYSREASTGWHKLVPGWRKRTSIFTIGIKGGTL